MMKQKIENNGDERIITISGKLDTLSARELDQAIQPLIADTGKSLTIKIDDLSYISSSGLRCFVQLYNATRAQKAEFHIEGIQPAIREIFEITGFSKIFGI